MPSLVDPTAFFPAPPPPPPRPPVTFLVLIDAQSNGDILEGLLVEGSDALGLPAWHWRRGRGRGRRRRGPGAPLGGHEGAGEALAEPHEEEPQVEGDQTQQREAYEQRVGEVVYRFRLCGDWGEGAGLGAGREGARQWGGGLGGTGLLGPPEPFFFPRPPGELIHSSHCRRRHNPPPADRRQPSDGGGHWDGKGHRPPRARRSQELGTPARCSPAPPLSPCSARSTTPSPPPAVGSSCPSLSVLSAAR